MPNGLAIPGGVTFPILAPNGTAAAPSYSFATATSTGLYLASATMIYSQGGTAALRFGDGITMRSSGAIAWSSGAILAAEDLFLLRDAANVLAQRRSTNAQTFRVYNTYTDASNYERAFLGFTSNVLWLATENAGTGTARSMVLRGAGITFRNLAGGGDAWSMASTGHFISTVDNTYDIGASGATRPRNVYAGGNGIFAGAVEVGVGQTVGFNGRGTIYASADGIFVLRNAAGTDFSRLCFGGTTSSFPAIRRVATDLYFRLADDTSYAGIRTGSIGFGNDAYTLSFGASLDITLARLAAASLRLGAAPSATPIAQTFTIGEASRPGTDTNVGGASATIRSGLGTGTGAASSIVFQTPTLVASGSLTQTYADRLTVATAGITATVPVLNPDGTAGAPGIASSTSPSYGFYFSSVWLYSSGGTGTLRFSDGMSMRSAATLSWSSGVISASSDLYLSRHSAANLRQGAAAANDADGVAQTLLAPDGGTVSAGTTGRAGANYIIRSGIGSDAKAGSGANGGPGGDFYLRAGAGGAGDGAGVAGTMGSVYIQTNATTRLTVSTTAVTSTLPFLQANGTAAAPSYAFTNLTSSGLYMASTGPAIVGLSVGGTAKLGFSTTGIIHDAAMLLMWSSTTPTGAVDLSLARLTTASLRQGAAPSATPVNQLFTIGEASRPGTDTNVAGANGTIRSGLGTGNATGSSLIFHTPDAVASGSGVQTYAPRLTLSAAGAVFDLVNQGFRINGQTSGAGAFAGTLTNAPSVGNPTFWMPINIAGVVAFFPCW